MPGLASGSEGVTVSSGKRGTNETSRGRNRGYEALVGSNAGEAVGQPIAQQLGPAS